ncbi:methyltransferase [Shewanella surugensis]|uniref:Ribosomal RNA large subunit methyltransferase G n=1 Tax=Shewanella surugensis TaxID=212020 RepID=A0ABT0LH75_9GAMM|nr:methyltransferase [Shewanella surugensis]MCL1127063.1 methyltransferase [Shewanella surugensis]
MATQFSVADLELDLHRFPRNQDSNLQAWDAADEHLVLSLTENSLAAITSPYKLTSFDNLAILNDNFGGLTCSLTAYAAKQNQALSLWVESDAKTSVQGIEQNLQNNQLNSEHIHWRTSTKSLPRNLNAVVIKLPKNLHYFTLQLQKLSHILPSGTPILIAAKAKSINAALLTLISQNLGPASASLTYKKTRVITCISDGKIRPTHETITWPVPEYQLTMHNLSNVFAANKLDIGARFMLENMPNGNFHNIVDLGCGNGILGLRAAQLFPEAHLHFVDDSDMAITSAKENWHTNQFTTAQGHFYWSDCLSQLTENLEPDLILCNPPFHQGEAITDHIAWQMFLDAKRRLTAGGILHVVGNRHLAYHVKLKRIFKNCTTVASNGKFVILQAQKR